MAAKDLQANRRRWMLFLILCMLLALIGMSAFLLPKMPSSSSVQASSNGNMYTVRTPPPPPTCVASVKVDQVLASGFQATVTVKNTSNQSLKMWMIYWSLPTHVTFVNGWNANVFQDGDVIMAHPFDSNRTFPAGGTISVGFKATGPADPPISAVTLNGILCTS